jgi:hypothetical protein
MEYESSLVYLQQPTTCPYLEWIKSVPSNAVGWLIYHFPSHGSILFYKSYIHQNISWQLPFSVKWEKWNPVFVPRILVLSSHQSLGLWLVPYLKAHCGASCRSHEHE